ncbi:MAG: AI-2E family transporter [bacterium]
MKDKIININITTSTIIKTIFILIILWFLIFIRGIIGVFLVALLLTAALKPMVDWLEKRKIPRVLGLSVIYLIFFTIISVTLILSIPPLIHQTKQLAQNFPSYWEKIISGLGAFRDFSSQHGLIDNINKITSSFENNLTNLAGNIFGTVSSIFGGVASFIFILVIAFYMTMEKNAAQRISNLLLPINYREKTLDLVNKLEIKIGLWVRGQIVLMIIIGAVAFIGLTILGINYALILGLIAGLTEIVPYLGPVLGAIPAVFIAFTQSPYKALAVIIFYFIIQELENDFIAPKVMEKAVGINPIISIFALLIGVKIAGIMGVLLSIPVATSIIVIIKEFYPDIKLRRNKKENNSA